MTTPEDNVSLSLPEGPQKLVSLVKENEFLVPKDKELVRWKNETIEPPKVSPRTMSVDQVRSKMTVHRSGLLSNIPYMWTQTVSWPTGIFRAATGLQGTLSEGRTFSVYDPQHDLVTVAYITEANKTFVKAELLLSWVNRVVMDVFLVDDDPKDHFDAVAFSQEEELYPYRSPESFREPILDEWDRTGVLNERTRRWQTLNLVYELVETYRPFDPVATVTWQVSIPSAGPATESVLAGIEEFVDLQGVRRARKNLFVQLLEDVTIDYGTAPFSLESWGSYSGDNPLVLPLMAQVEAPLSVGIFYGWGEDEMTAWPGSGALPQGDPEKAAEMQAWLGQVAATRNGTDTTPPRAVYDQSYLVSNLYTADPGEQEIFGGAMSGSVFQLSPMEIFVIVMDGAFDECLRPVTYLEANGDLVLSSNHPGHRTSRRVTFARTTRDFLGKPNWQPPIITENTERSGDDPQHTADQVLVGALTLFRFRPLEKVAQAIVEREAADNRVHAGYQNPSPRGVGRPLQALAAYMEVFEGRRTAIVAARTALSILNINMNQWDGAGILTLSAQEGALRPLTPLQVFPADGRIDTFDLYDNTKRRSSINPYEHAAAGRGFEQLGRALRNWDGMEAWATLCDVMAWFMHRTVLYCTVYRQHEDGRLTPETPYNYLALGFGTGSSIVDPELAGRLLPAEERFEASKSVHAGQSWGVWSGASPESFLSLSQRLTFLPWDEQAEEIASELIDYRSENPLYQNDRAFRFATTIPRGW